MDATHGTRTRYGKGCRCDDCTAANREYQRKYYEANPDRERERSRRKREAKPEYYRTWYEANLDKTLEQQRKYRAANAEKIRKKVRQWQEANPDKTRVGKLKAARARRARKFDAFVEHVDPQVVFGRDGWTCHICGELIDPELKFPDPLSASLDHIIPLAKGGEHSYANCATSHLGCNMRKSARLTSGPG
jgi:5-methylcytosine-specific restriction endonuclease McrA